MSDKDLARRVSINVDIAGTDVSLDINKSLLSLSYTDNEEDKTDDLQITLEDKEGIWINDWKSKANDKSPVTSNGKWAIGDTVIVNGKAYSSSFGGKAGATLTNYKGKITNLNLKDGITHPIHVDKKGWFAINDVKKATSSSTSTSSTSSSNLKGLMINATVVQQNYNSDGKDLVLNCGSFEIDTVDMSGPPSKVTIKCTSLPYKSTIRKQAKTKAWEKVKLSVIANEIAKTNNMECMFLSKDNPFYERKEQVQKSDIVFLQGLCKNAGISLKVTNNMLVLFDEMEYENKKAILTIESGKSNIINYKFSTKTSDVTYSKSKVTYTDPKTKKTIKYTYTPRNADKNGQVLEINEKVKDREEARQLAMKRLRQKNKNEFTADFNLVGDVRLVAGSTVNVAGYGMFDGKYIIETATHNITSGYTVGLKLRRVLEGY